MMSKDKYRYFSKKHEDNSNEFLMLAKVVDKLSKKIVQKSFFLAYQNASEEEQEWLEFDMIDDVKELRKIEVLFENDVENDFNIDENEKQELIDAVNSLLEIINIIKID